jgi:Capsular polysaccharide biosynthesis protein
MISPRKIAKAFLFHARGARIRALAAPRRVGWLRRRLRLPRNETFDPFSGEILRGVTVTRLDDASTWHRPLPAIFGRDSAALAFFSARTVENIAPSCVAEFENGIAWGHPTGGVFTGDGRFVPAFTHDPCGAARHTVWTRLHLPPARHFPGRILYLVTPEATDNFHHWMIDLLPRLGLVLRAGYRLEDFDRVIVNHVNRRFQRATLEHLGIPAEKLLAAHDSLWIRADSLVVPSLKASNQTFPAPDAAFLRDAFLPSDTATPFRRIFLSRNDAGFRRLANEAGLVPLLRAHGFEIITPGKLDLAAQARLFAEAAIIAGPAGAAFANLVFATPGTRVIEITPPGWLSAFHWMISTRIGLDHTLLLGEGRVMRDVPDVADRERDIVVDPAKFSALLESLPAPLQPYRQPA